MDCNSVTDTHMSYCMVIAFTQEAGLRSDGLDNIEEVYVKVPLSGVG